VFFEDGRRLPVCRFAATHLLTTRSLAAIKRTLGEHKETATSATTTASITSATGSTANAPTSHSKRKNDDDDDDDNDDEPSAKRIVVKE
jgi:hypothetical protein